MHLTHQELVEKRKQLIDNIWRRCDDLQQKAKQLCHEYLENLNAAKTPGIVTPGVLSGDGNFTKRPYHQLETDDQHVLNFAIATDLSEYAGRGDFEVSVRISVWRDDGVLKVSVENGEPIMIATGEPDGCFYDASSRIADLIATSLEKTMPH